MDILQSRPEMSTLIKNVALEQGFKNFEIVDVNTNTKGQGLMSRVYFIVIKDVNSNQNLEVVVKSSFSDDRNKSSETMAKPGLNEIYFYSKVCETFKKFQEKKGIQEDFEYITKCYKTFCNSQQQLLCLENLKMGNFEMIDTTTFLDHEHVSLVFQTYGRFHAYSYALRDQEPQTFEKLCDGLDNVGVAFIDDKNTGFAAFMKNFYELAYKCLIPGEDDRIIEKFSKFLGGESVQTYRKIITEKRDSFAILHGDCWSNNLMFKYTDTDNRRKLTDIKLFDFQLSKLGSPVCDLSYFLYSGASKEIFSNFKDYLKVYYESFSTLLRKLGSDPEKLFSYSLLEEHWKKYAMFGVFITTMILKAKLTQKEDLKDYSDGLNPDELVESHIKSSFDENAYQKHIRALFTHVVEIGVL